MNFPSESGVKPWEGVPESQKPEQERQAEGVIKISRLDEKHQKLKAQLDVVLENLILANSLIDESDPSNDI
jgi:hypothetical protein